MKKAVRQIFTLSGTLLLVAALIFLGVRAGRSNSARLCDRLSVEMLDTLRFVTEQDVHDYIFKNYGPFIGARADSIDLARIEELLSRKSVVQQSEAWMTADGVLHVSILQRPPVLRFAWKDGGCYIDSRGYVFPLHRSFIAGVPVVEGNIPPMPLGEVSEWGLGVLDMVRTVQGSKFCRDRVKSISVGKGGDLELRLEGCSERFIFGDACGTPDKLRRMEKYFTCVQPAMGEEYYKSVNLKYKKQIICRKDI